MIDFTTTLSHISLVNALWWLGVGLVTGYIIHLLYRPDVHGGVLGTLVAGILGAFVGGFLGRMLLGITYVGVSVGEFVVAIVGGLLFAYLSKLLFRKAEYVPSERSQTERAAPQYAYVGTKGGRASHATTNDRHSRDDGHHIVNPIQVEKYLRHVDYPTTKNELELIAKKEGADTDVLHTLERMPGDRFNSPVEVSRAIGHAT